VKVNKTAGVKLNPFALPTETDARFILLMMSAPALALALSVLLRYTLNPDADNPFSAVPPAPGDLPPDEFFRAQAEYGIQLMLASLSALLLPLSLIALTFLLAAIFYRDHPRGIRRRKNAVPFAPQRDPRFAGELQALSVQAGLPAPPGILMGKNLSAQGGQAFGVGRRKSLYLDAGLRLLLRKSVENFRAIVRHELAHIVNRDIGRTYFAQSLWGAVVAVTILPLLVSSLYLVFSSTIENAADGLASSELEDLLFVKLPQVATLLLQSAGLIALVLLIRAGLLRTREVYADWRAALWGSASTLAAVFETQSRRFKSGPSLFRLHPSPAERLQALQRPRLLFDIHFDVPFVVGVFTSLILNGLIPIVIVVMITVGPAVIAFNSTLIDRARVQSAESFFFLLPLIYGLDALFRGLFIFLTLLPFLILAPLAAATVGLQVQRQALADLAERRSGAGPYLRLALPAAWMGLGMAVGIVLSPLAILAPASPGSAFLAFCFLLVLVMFIWLALAYTRFFGIRLLGSHARLTPPSGKNRFLTALVSAVFLLIEAPLVVGFLFVTQGFASEPLQGILLLIGLALAMSVLMALSFASHWLVYRLYRLLRPVRCPACGQASAETMVVGRNCGRCGENMVPWLYVTGEGSQDPSSLR
jgi:Zn-dependent protease with chaperone function